MTNEHELILRIMWRSVIFYKSKQAINKIAFASCMDKEYVRSLLNELKEIGYVEKEKNSEGIYKWKLTKRGKEYIDYQFQEFLNNLNKYL